MSTYTDHLARASLTPSAEEMEQLATQQAHQLFAICDREQKGFITKRDMQRLQSELPLDPDQLEAVFDSLDDDKNGFLTLEEFTGGFGSYLGINQPGEHMSSAGIDVTGDNIYEDDSEAAEEEKQFQNLMESMGAHRIFEETSTLKSLWTKIRHDEPEMMSNFEDFLYKVTSDMQRSKVDLESLEAALKSKSLAHDEEVSRLYEEMEYQIKQEKEKILSEEQLKERHMREALEKEITEKDRQLQELLQKHQELEEKLDELNMIEVETKQENDKLQREKNILEDILMKSEENLEETKAYIGQLRSQQKDEKRERARAALKLTENIALERESLVKQLELLRDVNKRLRDDKDEAETRRILEAEAGSKRHSVRKKELCKQGSILGNYFPSNRGRLESTEESILELENNNSIDLDDVAENKHVNNYVPYLNNNDIDDDDSDDVECDDDYIISDQSSSFSEHKRNINSSASQNINQGASLCSNGGTTLVDGDHIMGSDKCTKLKRQDTDEDIENVDRGITGKVSRSRHSRSKQQRKKEETLDRVDGVDNVNSSYYGSKDNFSPDSPRGQPVGAVNEGEEQENEIEESMATQRQRLFKVVFVGDSGVGKSSFIHRFCNDHFNPTFSATIGVDFQVKTLVIDGQIIVLQLWDTAGQERFRSITKQYFRKADGVIVMYDVTSEASFMHIRNWMTSVQEGVEPGTALVIVGNKTDMCDGDEKRVVKSKDGSKMALEYDALFFETSAKTGSSIKECMEAMSNLLKEKEDMEIDKALHLEDKDKKKGCCS